MVNFIRGATRIYAPASARPDLREGRIIRETKREGAEELAEATQADEGVAKGDNYLSALIKLIPSEMIAVYNAIKDSAATHKFVGGWFLLCLGTCIILRVYANLPNRTDVTFWDVQWRSVGVSAAAFYLWAFGGGLVTEYSWLNIEAWLASALAALFGLIAPMIVPGDSRT
ncbi:UNVERIFIED_ORG: hypothetical protein M2425_002418 [Bradyrhizobium japonicum]